MLQDTLVGVNRTAFSPYKSLKVSEMLSIYKMIIFQKVNFLGNEAQDEGGPKCEFRRLLASEIKAKMCVGGED